MEAGSRSAPEAQTEGTILSESMASAKLQQSRSLAFAEGPSELARVNKASARDGESFGGESGGQRS